MVDEYGGGRYVRKRCDAVVRVERANGGRGSDDVIGFPLLNVCNQSSPDVIAAGRTSASGRGRR